jgi:DNA mismatch repair ATPase MutS
MFSNRKKKLEAIRNKWAKPIDKYRNFDFISLFHQTISSNLNNTKIVDDKTWRDLNFDDIFAIMDRNSSSIGQQYLYHLLHNYENDKDILNKRINLTEYFKNNSGLRELLQLELTRLNETNAYFIAPLIYGKLPTRPKYYYIFFVLSFLAGISIPLTIMHGTFFFFLLAVFILNLIVNNIFSKKIHQYFAGFSSLNLLLITVRKISKLNGHDIEQLLFFKEKFSLVKKLNKKIGSFVLDKAAMNEILAGIVDYINIYFLYDIIKYSVSVGLLTKHQKDIQKIFENVAQLDMAISLASYLTNQPFYCKPNFTENNSISFTDVYHPVIPDAIPNSLSNLDKSVLITGSNMAGKTTFIKTIGVNFIFAQTLNFCLSKEAIIPYLIVKSAINREEDLEGEKSYFYVEIEELQNFIKLSEKNSNYLFLIDEIFRGTNTVERLAASTAVLEYLNNNNFVFVTTHDIELQDLLNHKYEMFHFSEQVEDNVFFYDYKIRNGPTSSGNAIKLLEIKGYPESIIKKAKVLSNKFLSH